ncbi:protein piccolo [Galendromus occidentalis]|uniref:Protein piccolo n=1 Tax=Galendromus occidentalis TaxID=34638 RepID=A0AAJ6QWE5_9ACAR|nr:protein piccolo [Galendromus occidentalis]
MTKKTKSKKKSVAPAQPDRQKDPVPQVQGENQKELQKLVPNITPAPAPESVQKPIEIREVAKPKVPEVSIIPIGVNIIPAPAPSAESAAPGKKKKKKRNKKKGGQQESGESESSPAVTVIPLNKDPGTIPAHLNPAVVLARQSEPTGPKVIEASPVVTLIGSNKKAQGHGALYSPPPRPQLVQTPQEEVVPDDKLQTISGGFKFPSSLQPVFETPESVAVSTGVVLDTETSGVLTIVPVRQDGVKKRRNRNKILPPCCELRGTSGLEVVCPHSNKPILNYNTVVNEDIEKNRQLQETQESLQRIH